MNQTTAIVLIIRNNVLMLRSSSNYTDFLVDTMHVTLNRKWLIAIARCISRRVNALTWLAELRCRGANKTRVFCRPRRFIAVNIWLARSESKIRDAHRRTNASALVPFLRLPCARVRMFSSGRLKYLAYFCWELIRAVIPASGCALKILSTNNPPATHLYPLFSVMLKGAYRSRTCLQFPRVSVPWGSRLYSNIRGEPKEKYINIFRSQYTDDNIRH